MSLARQPLIRISCCGCGAGDSFSEMKIFLVVKVPRGDTELERLADIVAEVAHQSGHEPFVATYEISNQGLTDPKAFMPFARQHVESSDLMIVLYHPELRGGLVELGIAYANNIPVWLCCKTGEKISSSARGCAGLILEYRSPNELRMKLATNLRQYNLNP
jgi:nucleoside 2-deoxyribosyltransferase